MTETAWLLALPLQCFAHLGVLDVNSTGTYPGKQGNLMLTTVYKFLSPQVSLPSPYWAGPDTGSGGEKGGHGRAAMTMLVYGTLARDLACLMGQNYGGYLDPFVRQFVSMTE